MPILNSFVLYYNDFESFSIKKNIVIKTFATLNN